MLKELTRVLVVVALAATSAAHAGELLKVGVSAGPYAEILVYAGEIAAKEGIEIETIEFSDYTMPNAALAEGDIDFNNFQHLPYLQNQVKPRGYDIVELEKSIIVPLGLYSRKLQKTALFLEGPDAPWSLWFAALRSRKDDPQIRRYIEIYRSPAVKDFILARFEGTIIPTW